MFRQNQTTGNIADARTSVQSGIATKRNVNGGMPVMSGICNVVHPKPSPLERQGFVNRLRKEYGLHSTTSRFEVLTPE